MNIYFDKPPKLTKHKNRLFHGIRKNSGRIPVSLIA